MLVLPAKSCLQKFDIKLKKPKNIIIAMMYLFSYYSIFNFGFKNRGGKTYETMN